MKKIILPAIAGATLMALGACSEAQAPEAPAATDATTDSADPAMAAPSQERVPMTSDTTTTETPDRITIDKNGVSANIKSDDTAVTVDTKGGTSATVTTK